MEAAWMSDPRLDTAVRASLSWYQDVFGAHGIPTRCEGGLWSALGDPPRWHSAAKTLHPDVPVSRVLAAVEPFESCAVADTYGTLNLAEVGFRQLFRATWFHRPARPAQDPSWPDGWSVVADDDELSVWNTAQDTTGVLIPALRSNPRFTLLAQHSSDGMVGGAVLHRVDDAVELSNTWSHGDEARQLRSVLRCAEALYPQLAVVGYTSDDTLSTYTDAGFSAIGPHVVWLRGN